MLFESKYVPGIQSGTITLTFRRWKRPQAVAGNTYRTIAGRLLVEDVAIVAASDIPDSEAAIAGFPDAATLVARLRGEPDLPIYRVRFRHLPEPDPRDELAAAAEVSAGERADLAQRLARLDRASATGPWTAATLDLIAGNPAVRAGDLAPRVGQGLPEFKLNVRKLKNLGLTISLGTGYRLSPRGEAWLHA